MLLLGVVLLLHLLTLLVQLPAEWHRTVCGVHASVGYSPAARVAIMTRGDAGKAARTCTWLQLLQV